MSRFNREKMFSAIVYILSQNRVKKKQAEIIADCMISADEHGINTHGVNMLPAYEGKLAQNSYELKEEPVIVKQTAAFATVDAKNTIGMYSAYWCMKLALDMCKKSGIYYVFSKNSNTFGPAFYYTKMAAMENKIGICFSNTPAAMAPWGGKKRLLGTNPFSVSIPANKKGPVLLDMATSAVAKSKINEIRKAGGKIPEGWALDKDGNPTTDPVEAINGFVLPMAAHKGSGIAMIIDILAGVLSGGGFLSGVNKFYSQDNSCMNVGQCFIAIDPSAIYSENFYDVMDGYIDEIHSSGENVWFPGEKNLIDAKMSRENGIELCEETSLKLEELFKKYGIN